MSDKVCSSDCRVVAQRYCSKRLCHALFGKEFRSRWHPLCCWW